MTYAPALAFSGAYEVFAWVAPDASLSKSVPVTIHHEAGESVTILDQTVGAVGWHSLGTFNFQEGNLGWVTLTAKGSGTVVADAFKWISAARYNDGSEVSQVTLQPQDGIVLLKSCYEPEGQVYLPLLAC